MLRANQIAKLAPHKRPRTSRMLADHHLVPDPHLFLALHNDKLQSSHITALRGNVLRHSNRFKKTSWTPSAVLHKRRGQNNVAALLQFPQGLQTSSSLGCAAGIEESIVLAELIREHCSVHNVIAIKH